VAVQEVRRDNGGSEPTDDYAIFYGNENANHHLGTGFFVRKGIISAAERVEFVSDRMSYVILRCRWCDIIILNVCIHQMRMKVMIRRITFAKN